MCPSQLAPPGSLGLPYVGWSATLDFVRNPVDFVRSQVSAHGPIFKTRILNGKTVIAASYASVWSMLCGPQRDRFSAPLGYGEFMGGLFGGPNMLLSEKAGGDSHEELLRAFGPAFAAEAVEDYMPTVRRVVERRLQVLLEGVGETEEKRLVVYDFFKELAVDVMTTLLFEETDAETREDIRTHFQALCSIPINVNIAGGYIKSGFGKGIEAGARIHQRLLRQIDRHLELQAAHPSTAPPRTLFSRLVRDLPPHPSAAAKARVASHLALLSSNIIPKALASLLTSLTHHLATAGPLSGASKPEPLSKPALTALILETLRLRPPLLGGLRTIAVPTPLAQYTIPAPYRVWYSAQAANLDPRVYPNPGIFDPARWAPARLARPNFPHNACPFAAKLAPPPADRSLNPYPLSFGAGPRMCLGRALALRIVEEAAQRFLGRLEWRVEEESRQGEWRWMPVLRPVDGLVVRVRKRRRTEKEGS